MLRSAAKLLRHARGDDPGRWDPLLAVYYLTYRCEFRCPYCSDGAQNPYYRLRANPLPAPAVIDLLHRIRRHASYLVLTGGEPLQHPDFAEVLRRVPEVGFEGVVLTTNGDGLAPHLPLVRRAVTDLVFSLDTLDHARADAWFGVGTGALARILDTIERARRDPGRASIIISSVVTPDNLDDLDAVADYARARGFRFAACPQLVGVKAHPALTADPRYRRFYDGLIARKRRGDDIQGTVPYLEAMRDLRRFRCRPFTMLVVAPEGEVFYPCLELGHYAGNLRSCPDLHALRRAGERLHGPQPDCDVRCHSACALGFSVLLERPWQVVGEGWLRVKGAVRGAVHGGR
ncbi:MAG TPA: radical SAM protein [Polyangia bacterium]